jgi:hypothetical protein
LDDHEFGFITKLKIDLLINKLPKTNNNHMRGDKPIDWAIDFFCSENFPSKMVKIIFGNLSQKIAPF